jgi:hypothetical protein
MASAVYILCTLTSMACAVLLIRGYHQSRKRLLLWSSLCFWGMTLNNLILFIDLSVLPDSVDLAVYRNSLALFSTMLLLFGLVWETE